MEIHPAKNWGLMTDDSLLDLMLLQKRQLN